MEVDEQSAADLGRVRQRLAVIAAVVLVVLLLAVTPPLLNVSRYQRRIVTSMSESLGRPVHLDKVTLHLLPMPGFTLDNFVVSEDPAFGNEPTIRANEVTATLRVSSLWHRRVEFSSVKFDQPSVNLVRSPEGRWNLEGVLLHASHVDTAPTAQQRAGDAPRFPYIEATGGRINLKLGQEKMPFSLTNADFALWLPSPQTWRVRLEGKPSRTDSNIGDPGIVRIEGSLQRAAHMEEVPVDLHASWYDAPLGGASRLVSGGDRGWRGTLHADAWLKGQLGNAALKTKITVDDLRRADFVPVHSLDQSASCASTADVPAVRLTSLHCVLPIDGGDPVEVSAAEMDISHPKATQARLQARKLPVEWVFGWMRLFSARIPASPRVQGTLAANLVHDSNAPAKDWNGTVRLTMPLYERRPNGEIMRAKSPAGQPPGSSGPATPAAATSNAATQQFEATLSSGANGWTAMLSPTPVRLGPGADLTVSGQASPTSYSFTLAGQASAAQLAAIVHAFPQLADDTGLVQPAHSASADSVHSIQLSCTRTLAAGQTCSAPVPQPRRSTRRNVRSHR